MINSIRGLWAQVKYPLGFTKNGLKADSSCILFGAGNTGTGGNIGGSETTTVVNAGFIKYYFESLAASGTNVGLYINATKGAAAGMTALKIVVSGGATALDLGSGALSFSAPSTFTSADNHLIAIGTYNTPLTIPDTGTTFVPINVSLSSAGNAATPGNQVAAARLRVNAATANQANTAISCLQLRSDIGVNIYAFAGLSGSLNISAAVAIPTGSLQGIYYQVTGAGPVTCPNEPNVMEIGYHQSSGGGGFRSVARFDVNATGCSITDILRLKNYAGTVTNGLLIEGAMTKGIYLELTAIGAAGRIAQLNGTSANPNFGDAYGAVEVNLNVTGTVAGMIAATSSWVNMGSGSSGGTQQVSALDVGVYAPASELANAKVICGVRMSYVVDSGANAGSLFLFGTNIFSNALTAMFDINTLLDLNATSGAASGNDLKIPFFKERSTGVTWYINAYHT